MSRNGYTPSGWTNLLVGTRVRPKRGHKPGRVVARLDYLPHGMSNVIVRWDSGEVVAFFDETNDGTPMHALVVFDDEPDDGLRSEIWATDCLDLLVEEAAA